jgi:3-deoxy-D-manno-octulosonic-acid transferase
MRNFTDPARVLVDSGGARQVSSPNELQGVLRELLADPAGRKKMAARGREAVLANQGAIVRSLDLLEEVLQAAEGDPE